jgi:hypothetical protein
MSDEIPSGDIQKEFLAFLEALKSPDFHGLAGCGHHHHPDEDGVGILWNDAGHRLQIERAIWILAAVEPAGEFLSLWSRADFREGFYTGLWQADYRPPWNNTFNTSHNIPLWLFLLTNPLIAPVLTALALVLNGKALYTSHFWNPETNKTIVDESFWLKLIGPFIEQSNENAWTRVRGLHYEAAKRLDSWRDTPNDEALREAGRFLGLASHFFTDLTQPMHAANFANLTASGGVGVPNYNDYRHSRYEALLDQIINNVQSEYRARLLCDASKVDTAFSDNLEVIVRATASHAKTVFDDRVKPLMVKLENEGRINAPINPGEGFSGLEAAVPAGQVATARFFQQWARQSHDQNPSLRLRSDWIAVSERKDQGGKLQPCMFYRQDGDLLPVFRYFNQGDWREDKVTFQDFKFARGQTSPATAFAACYDKTTEHPAVFIAGADGKLYYFAAPDGAWTKTEIALPVDSYVRGALVCTFDERSKKPHAFYRDRNGFLCYVHWQGNRFGFWKAEKYPRVGGAIAVVWDPADCGLGGEVKGHLAVSYVGGDGAIQHLRVRNGDWTHTEIAIPADVPAYQPAQADPQMLASVYDAQAESVGVFWGLLRYERKFVPEDPNLWVWEQQPARIRYSVINSPKESIQVANLPAVGGIGATATATPIIAVYCLTYKQDIPLAFERINKKWVANRVSASPAAPMVAATQATDGSVIVGARLQDRKPDLWRYQSPITLRTGDIITLQASDKKYLSRIRHNDVDRIEAAKDAVDVHCKFKVTVLDDGRIALQADAGTNRYLSRIHVGSDNFIQAAKEQIDDFSKFSVIFWGHGPVAITADNGQYFSTSQGAWIRTLPYQIGYPTARFRLERL